MTHKDAEPGDTCWRRSLEFMERFNARDWEWIEDFYLPEVVFDDRRPGLTSVVTGRAKQLEHMHVIAEVGSTQSRMVKIAERGDRLALCRVDWSIPSPGSDPFVVETLMVAELNDAQRCVGLAIFDTTQLDAAYEDLDARFDAQA